MASDPTDLIREADEALDGITPGPWRISSNGNLVWGEYEPIAWLNDEGAVEQVEMTAEDARLIAAAPALVRRLRDALAASESRAEGRLAALAEANATIERVRAAIESPAFWGHGQLVKDAIRRAIEGPSA
ncbi:hypothetical protein [Tsukamurella paurometabola]|uniref:Uncharacterized protein n=1 Tax=Tsukamurella paurometabola TaxID=2061 RepID=A0ABS5NDR6_TSUPA|nr:hypothetical protein [Tsukamurella paurometabola]MBS4102421.1 hypothetical protein [Tsukamurella paurometabola]